MAQVFGENTDGFIVGSLFTEGGKLSFNGRLQQAAVGILHGFGYMASAFVGAAYELAIESFEAFIVVRVILTFSKPSASARRMASRRCEVQRFRGEEKSK